MDAQRDVNSIEGSYGAIERAVRDNTVVQLIEGYTIKVKRLSNGFVLTTSGWQGTYYPDLKSLIRAITIHIGGVDAVEVPDVSAEEAGLLSGTELTLELTLVERVINAANRWRQETVAESNGMPSWKVQQGIDGIFKRYGYADMHDFITTKVHKTIDMERLLNEFSNPEVSPELAGESTGTYQSAENGRP